MPPIVERRSRVTDPSRDHRLVGAAGDGEPAQDPPEWLITNGLGGYACGTVTGLITRRYHGDCWWRRCRRRSAAW